MTHKDYVAIAGAFARSRPDVDGSPDGATADAWLEQWKDDVDKVAAVLQKDNPRFRREEFLGACWR